MKREHPLNRSDHRAAILHCDANSHTGMGSLQVAHNDVKPRIRAAASTLEHGELSRTAEA